MGTVVRMCDGSYQPIETVQAGQWVLARDASTGELACKEVVDPYANPDRSIIVLELQAEDGTIEAIETTPVLRRSAAARASSTAEACRSESCSFVRD